MSTPAWTLLLVWCIGVAHLLALWQAGRRVRRTGWVLVPLLSTCLGLGCAWLAMEKPNSHAAALVQQWPAAAMCR